MTYRRMQHIWTCIIWHHIPIWCFASLHINFSKVIKMIKTLFKSIIGEHYHGTILTIADGSFVLKTQSLLVRKNFSEVQRGMKWAGYGWYRDLGSNMAGDSQNFLGNNESIKPAFTIRIPMDPPAQAVTNNLWIIFSLSSFFSSSIFFPSFWKHTRETHVQIVEDKLK